MTQCPAEKPLQFFILFYMNTLTNILSSCLYSSVQSSFCATKLYWPSVTAVKSAWNNQGNDEEPPGDEYGPEATWKVHYEVDHGALYGALVFCMKASGFCQRRSESSWIKYPASLCVRDHLWQLEILEEWNRLQELFRRAWTIGHSPRIKWLSKKGNMSLFLSKA